MIKKTLIEIQKDLDNLNTGIKILSRDKEKGFFEDSEFGVFEGNINNVSKGKQQHPNRNKTFKNLSFEEIKNRVNLINHNLELIEFNGTKNKAVFLDKQYGQFIARFDFVIKGKALHKERSKAIRKQIANLNSTKEKKINTIYSKYGVENISQVDEVKLKRKITFKNKFGGHPQQNVEIKNKTQQTLVNNNGGVHFFSEPEKMKEFWRNALGVDNPNKRKDIRNKIQKTRIENGLTNSINGITLSQYILDNNLSVSKEYLSSIYRKYGKEAVINFTPTKTIIETIIYTHLSNNNTNFIFNKGIKEDKSIKFDYLINDKLIIECDGLYWHSELNKNKNYHINKKTAYTNYGYDSLFFRQDEIFNKTKIVCSMINNKLNKNQRIFARKCTIEEVAPLHSKEFLNNNHLMGNGSGKCWGLYYNNQLMSIIQIVFKEKNIIEISRFCTKLNTVIVGGLGKLLSFLNKNFNLKKIISFVDMRYGNGSSLITLGFKEKSHHVSFKWTNGVNVFHRMRYKSNSGYDYGLYKIWDCGQKKFELLLEK